MRLKTVFAVLVIGLSVVSWNRSASATVMTYDMSWTGVQGFSITGAFSFDDAKLPASQVVTFPELEFFEATAFKPDGTALETYFFSRSDYSIFSTSSFNINFNFEADTGTLRQAGTPAPFSSEGLFFGEIVSSNLNPNGWAIYGGSSCGALAGFIMVLDEPSLGCITFKDYSRENYIQVTLRGQTQADVQIPEPGTLAMFGFGLASLGFAARRKRA